jgi:hypothetical protein
MLRFLRGRAQQSEPAASCGGLSYKVGFLAPCPVLPVE